MLKILRSFPFFDLPTKPPIGGQINVSEDIQQTIALLSGWDGTTRRIIRCSPTGVIRIGSPPVAGILKVVANQDAYTAHCDECPTSEVMVRCYPDNIGKCFLNIGVAAAFEVGYPLFAGEWVRLSVNNMNRLYLYIEKDTDIVVAMYTE